MAQPALALMCAQLIPLVLAVQLFSMEKQAQVLVGCSGYSYPEWIGPFYPPGTPRSRLLDRYAEHFDVLEINYTYYRMPTASSMARMAQRTGGGLTFVVKANSALTHERVRDPAMVTRFTEALEPLREAGVLGAVLAQFPQSFHADRPSARYVNWLHEQMGDLPLVIELRNGGWARKEVYEWLRRKGIALCNVDQPRLPALFPVTSIATAPLAYIRFHGRNADSWYQPEDPGDRYAYRYDEAELLPWVERIRELIRRSSAIFILFNNHRDGFAPANARQFQTLLQRAGIPTVSCG